MKYYKKTREEELICFGVYNEGGIGETKIVNRDLMLVDGRFKEIKWEEFSELMRKYEKGTIGKQSEAEEHFPIQHNLH